MKLSNTTVYTLKILIYMAKVPSKWYSAKQLVEKLKVSDKYLRRIMTDLSKSGFIKSVKGREGGYLLAKEASEVSLYDIINSVEDLSKLNNCVLGFEPCSCENPCAMHETWVDVRNKLNTTFYKTKLSDMDFDNI